MRLGKPSYIKIFIAVLFIFFLCINSHALSVEPSGETASLSGYVQDSTTEETLIGATVSLEKTKIGAYTNKSGFFSITAIPPGKYNIIISFVGYKRTIIPITFNQGQSVRKTFKIAQTNISTKEVSVEAEKEVEKREITISRINVPVKELKQIRIAGESDVFRSLQYLPGILTSSQISSGLFVRGGSPDQNLVLLDGSTIYNPSHLFGFISTFNTDAIKDVELIKGGFPAEYGGRLSAVLNLTQKDGNQKQIDGLASIGAISSKLFVEGPSPFGDGSWFVSGRRTYIDLILNFVKQDPLNPYPNFNFYDLNGKFTQKLGDDDKIFLSGFMSADNLSYDSRGFTLGLDISNRSAAFRWTHIFNDNLFTVVNLNTSRYKNSFSGDQSGYGFLIENGITDYTLKASAEWFVSKDFTVKTGLEETKYTFDFFENFSGNKDTTAQSGTLSQGLININLLDYNHSLYAQTNYNITDLLNFQAGLRANYWSFSKRLTYDPRIALRYQLGENSSIKAAWGIYHQNLKLVSQLDFSFFDTWLPSDSSIAPSIAYHYILSYETQLFEDYSVNFDVYYKKISGITEINNNLIAPSKVSDILYTGKGDAYGAEIFVQRKIGKLVGWFGYALGYITAQFDSINNGQPFRPKYDRRHDLKLVLQYTFDEHWDVGMTFLFQSGQSYTGASSWIPIKMDEYQIYGRGVIFPTQRYGLRLPPSHQLNINGSYSFKMFGLQSKLIVDIFNVYNRRDIWFRRYDTSTGITQIKDVLLLPIIPSLSFEIKF